MRKSITGTLAIVLVFLVTILSACAPAEKLPDRPAITEKPPAVEQPVAKPMPYTPLDKDNAAHNAAGMIYEWWYLDAAFDNGYSTSFSWQVVTQDFIGKDRPTRLVQFAIYDPSGKKTSMDVGFKPEEVTVSADTCNVKMGNNQLKGSYPKWEVSFREGDLGAQLTFESLVEGFKTPPDGVVYFSRQPEKYIGWVIAQPRAKVTGKLILNGKEIPVSGVGYHDHNWGNCSLKEMYNYWYWGRMYLPEYTFVYSVGEMVDALGKKPSSVIFAFKGSKLLEVTQDITVEASDFLLDSFTGAKYPQSVVLHPTGRAFSGTVKHKLRNLVEALPPWGAKEGEGHAYFRFLSDCDIDLVVTGDKIQVKTPLIHEYMIP